MTVIRPNSVSGINSITVQSGNSLAIHKADGVLLRTITGTTGVSTFSSISVGTAYTDNSAAKSINIGVGASISQHDANTLSLGTNGDERVRIDSSGRLLLGTFIEGEATADDFTIGSVNGTNDAGITVRTASNGTGRLFFSDGTSGTAEYQGYLQYNHSSGLLSLGSGGSTRMIITDVGISTFTEPGTGNGMGGVVASTATGGGNAGFQWATNSVGRFQVTTIGSAGSEDLRVYDIQNDAERLRITSTGDINVSTAATIKANGNATFSGIVTATSFIGDGSGLSGVTAVTINSNADNRIITGSGTANTLNGESELTYSTYLNLTRGSTDTNFGDNAAPGAAHGFFTNNSQSTNGVFSAISLAPNDANGTNQSGSFIVKSVSGGYTPEIHIGSRTGNNSTESNFKITSTRSVELRYQGSTKIETASSGAVLTGDNSTGHVIKGVTRFCPNGSTTVKAMWDETGFSNAGHFQVKDGVAFSVGNSSDLKIYHNATDSYISNGTNNLRIGNTHDNNIKFFTNNSTRWNINGSGHIIPDANDTYDIGSTSYRVRNIYTGDLNLSNEGSSNDVDGTWGSYTIQEGENDLFLINKRNGKKYTFNLTEVV